MQQAATAFRVSAGRTMATDVSPPETIDTTRESTATTAHQCPLPQVAIHRLHLRSNASKHQIGPGPRCPMKPQRPSSTNPREAPHTTIAPASPREPPYRNTGWRLRPCQTPRPQSPHRRMPGTRARGIADLCQEPPPQP